MPVDVDGSAVVCGNHELDRCVVGDGDEPCVMQHEPVGATAREWFAFEVSVDVVFCLNTALRVRAVRTKRRYLVDGVADRVESWLRVSLC